VATPLADVAGSRMGHPEGVHLSPHTGDDHPTAPHATFTDQSRSDFRTDQDRITHCTLANTHGSR
jgi:hypothetical protein